MFRGSIVYKLNENVKYKYNVKGVDNPNVCSLLLSSGLYNANEFLGCDKEIGDVLETRRFDIELAKIKVETNVRLIDGKKKKSPVNANFFCRVGALIRYAKSMCITVNADDYSGLELASNEFEAIVEKDYTIHFPCDKSRVLAHVSLSYGDIKSLHLQTDDITIDFEDVGRNELFYKITDGFISGIALNSDYLGFEMPQQTLVDVTNTTGMYSCIEDIVKAHPDKEFSWLLKKNYIIVDDEHLDEIYQYIINWDGYVFYDTETTGLNITFKSRIGQADQLVGVVLSVKYGESFYFPTQMKSIKNLCGGDHWYFMEHYMRPILEGKELVAHNMTFDWKVAYIYDINANIVHDTLALIKLTLGAERKNFPMGLKELTKILLGRDSLELSDLVVNDVWGESNIKFWDLPYELVRLYACADTDNTNGLLGYALQADLLQEYNAKKVYEIEIAFSYAVAYQEFFGHRIDIANLDRIRKELGQGQKDMMNEMLEIVGHDFNPNSSKQLIEIMYKELKIPEQISRKTGRLTTDKETLKHLAELTDEDDNVKYPFCKYLLKYREYEGVRKIVDKFPEHVSEDGYVFSSVMQYGTTTGRVSINSPNYQSYNDPIKKNVVPRPGYYMFDTDYSSVEYRVLGNMVGNKSIIERFKDPDFDYHAYQAAHMYGVPYSAVTKKLRKAAKGINFGLPYGMGDESLGVRVFGEASPENTQKAASLRNAYFKGQEDIRDWFEYHRNRGVNEGFTETYFGRRRYYHKQDFSEAAIRRQAGNQVIQGCLDGNTRIQTYDYGIVKIKDVVNQSLLVWNGEKWTLGEILYSGRKQKCIVKFKGGQTFICSPSHKFLVVDSHGRERWVEAQDLKFGYKSSANNSHVRINENYESSGNTYTSEFAYNYATDNHESNNVFLDDIESSFDIGVFLGRLASDGSYQLREDGGSYITHFIAKHEYNIIPELASCMENLNYVENTKDRSNEEKEEMKTLSVYSTSLVKEILDLDIKHQVHDNIFSDTEVLRGFISGFYDGDGGISGKTITLTFGTQYDFEPMILDLQKALLFLGIRSRYRYYENDRYVLAIKTNDNQRFLDLVGFLNQDKQDKGRSLKCIEEEKTFGRCIIVDSVEITDELIDMYDVCNTDDGYYIADGIVTHNTAADIYKTAVGRVFKRVCKEGWLGKVLFTGFIHDELLGEVSNDIDSGVFLKVLREEFEIKITNTDGSPWCPLYMGFGYGMSWYEAKSVELPIKLQWELVEKYGEKGYPDWDGDGRKFCDAIPDRLREFDVRDIRNQLLDVDSQGKEIKPTLNNQIIDCIKYDKEHYKSGISSYITEYDDVEVANEMGISSYLETHHEAVCKYLDEKYHIQELYKEDCKYKDNFESSKETQRCIDLFCILHSTDRSKVDLKNIEEVDASNMSVGNMDFSDGRFFYEDEEMSEEYKESIKKAKINILGMYFDPEDKTVTMMKNIDAKYLNYIQSLINHDGKGYKVIFRDILTGDEIITKAYLPSENVNMVQELYIHLLRSA